MKRAKRIYGLLGVLVVLLIATLVVVQYKEKKEEIKNSGETILKVDPEEVTSLSWTCDNGSFGFHKEENWIYDEDEAFPVKEEKIKALLSSWEDVKAAFVIENVEDYGQYGLDDPECRISVKTEAKEYEILLGDFSTMDSQRYFSMGDGNVYLIADDPAEDYEIELKDLIAQDEVPTMADPAKIVFAGAKNHTITLEEKSETYSEEDLYYTEQGGKKIALDPEKIDDYLQILQNLDLTDYKTYKATEEDLKTYGLDEPELTVSVQYSKKEDGKETEEKFQIAVGRDPKEAASTEEDEIIAYVRIGDSKLIYEITATEYKSLVKVSVDDLRHEEMFWADFDSIKEMEVTLDDQTYTITAEGKGEDRTFRCGEKEMEITDLKEALTSLKASQFTKEEATGKEEIRLTIRLENETVSQVTMAFYRCDGSKCLATVDGAPTAYVSRSQVVDLVEAVNQIVLE